MPTTNTGFSGIDERQNGSPLILDASLKDSSGALITSGSTLLSLVEVQSDGTFKSYDFADNTFKTTALGTATVAMTHQKANNGATNTGIWTYALSTIAGFTVGANYRQIVTNSGASPTQQERAWQFAGGPNDKASSLQTTIGAAGAGLTAVRLAAAGIDAILIESGISASAALVNDTASQLTSINARQALALIQSALAAILSGAAGTTISIDATGKASITRITATVDASGNRSAVNLQVPT